MTFRILEFVAVLAFVQWIGSLPLSCLYNETSYKEGETVKTDEPCLSCICQNGALECSLRVCAEYPKVLPPGCFLLHKPDHCCLQIFCDENFKPTDVELRTSFKSEKKLHENDCIINGSIYKEGSAVASSQPCEYCYCVEGEIKCIKPRCSQLFEGCKPVYETSSCCPTHYDCRESNVSLLTSQMKNFVPADINVTVLNDSLKSHLNVDLKPEKGNHYVKENIETILNITEGNHTPESAMTIIEERNTEKTTVAPPQKSTIPLVEDYLTTLDFQTTKTENFSEEMKSTEDSTLKIIVNGNFSSSIKGNIEEESKVQMQRTLDSFKGIESSIESQDGSRNNASQEIDDYDSYDYSEPQLPPSLPNLVIFPFVAADAVVKGESTREPDSFDKDQVEKIDSYRVFYRDYFSPPVRSEGGFVPKKPPKPEESFYMHTHLNKEQIESPNEDMRENAVAASQAKIFPPRPNGMNFPDFADNTETNATFPDRLDDVLNATVDSPFEDIVRPDLEKPPRFLLRADDEVATFHENNQTKKPVTVTFKNFFVDFYPNYLITTSKRFQFQTETQTTAGESFITEKSQNASVPLDPTTSDPFVSFSDKTNSSAPSEPRREIPTIIPVNSTGRETFSFNKFIHSFLSEATSATTVAMTSTSKKHKFSSKIKNQFITTVKPTREKVSQKVEPEVDITNLSTESSSVLSERFAASFSVADRPQNYDEKRELFNLEITTRFLETVKPTETKNEKVELSEALSGGNISSADWKPATATVAGDHCATPNAGTLLKLAGCNIYGMMYRVGKVIAELSGPCLECLCTDLGVECKPLKC